MGVKRYIAARLAWAVVVSFVIVTIAFVLLYFSPNPNVTEAVTTAAMEGGDPQEELERQQEVRGLDQPMHVQYLGFIENVYTLEWGWSEHRSEPVTSALLSGIYYTAQYSVPWTVLSVLIAPVLGVYSASRMYSWKDHAATGFAFFGLSIPNFFFGIVLLLVFGVWLGWVPITYNTDVPVFSIDNVIQLSLPVVVLVTGSIGGTMRVARNESAEFIYSSFMKTAKAKGVSGTRAYGYHVMRPTMVPLSTSLVSSLLYVFIGSSLLVEVVFSIPGLGRITFDAVIAQDTNLVLGSLLFFTFIAVAGNLLEDLVYTVLDPRINYDDR